ncbi:unnamed protein product [Spirodela intermedia]|uniref:TOG domain-containing protein n=1 Tax=Spirodela intermedia TaxID=51605 RepID=A0A7I8K182_SPIIN|nr:unnamed protein product [Spirodela intermedia]
MEPEPTEVLRAASSEVSTSSTKQRIQIFSHTLPAALRNAEVSADFASLLVDIIFKTMPIYDDRQSINVVDSLIVEVLVESPFMKSFAAVLVLSMEKQSPNIYKMYIEEIKDSRISYKDGAGLIQIVLEFSTMAASFFEQYKQMFLEVYLKAVLNAKEKPSQLLINAFHPLFEHLVQEDFKEVILPTSLKMLKRNPELVLESVVDVVGTTNLDLSKYAMELLSVVLPQVRHADEKRRSWALTVVGCLAQKSSDPDILPSMFNTIKAVIGGSEGKLALPYQRVGMFNSIQELSKVASVKQLNSLASSISAFLLYYYKDEGNEEVKLIILSALASWAAKAAETVQPDVVLLFAAGLKEKEALRRGHLRCLRIVCKNPDILPRLSNLLELLVQLVKTGFTKVAQRLDGIYALFSLARIFSMDVRAEELMMKEKIWSLISQNESPLLSLPMAMKLGNEDCVACVDLLEILLVDHTHSDAEYPVDAQVPFLPPTVLLVKSMLLIAPAALSCGPWNCAKLIFCSHHPCISFNGRRDAVWKELFGPMGLMSSNSLNRETAVRAFATLMSVTPNHTFMEFKKHIERLPDWSLHNELSENDIKIFHTPEGMLSNKIKTAKEEARELLLKEEASVRDKVMGIRRNLSVVCRALGFMAAGNPVYAHGQLPLLILEKILLSSKKTSLHDNVLRILSLHLDPILPLPRLKMLSALYHVLSVVPAYQAKVGPMLNELCLGLQSNGLGQALQGVYAKDVHVRLACLSAVKCIPCVSGRSLVQNIDVATGIWISLHDPEKVVAEAAEDIWDRYGFDFGTDYSGLYVALSHANYNETLSTLFSMYIQYVASGTDIADAGWLGRQGIAMALHSAADVLRTKDLPVVITFLISRALADPNIDVRGRMINAGIVIIDRHGKENVSLLFPIFENYLNKKASNEEKYDLIREGVVIFTGALAKHLAKDDAKVHDVVEKLLDVLNTPSEAVQRAVSDCLSPLMVAEQGNGKEIVSRLLNRLMKSDKYGERRGAAFGLAGVIKGFGIRCLKTYGIMTVLQEGLEDRSSAKSREGALLGFECLCEKLGRLFEPYVIQYLPLLLVSFSDQVAAVREAAECAARAIMSQLSGHGVKLILPSLLKGLEDKAWRTKQSSVQLLGAMAFCAPQQLSQCLPKIVPKLTEVLTDTHPKVQSAGQMALQQVGNVIKNPEIAALVPTLLMGLTDPNEHTKHSLDILLQTTFINSVDAPSLALLVPIVHRGLRERSVDTKKKAAQITGNMCSLVTEPKDMIPYISLLLPEVKKVLVDPIPEVRSVAARAIGSLIRGMGEENFPDLVSWLLDTLKSDSSNVERSGAAQGLSEVLAALGEDYFERLLPDIIRNCSHQKASVRDGYLTLFKYLPRSLGATFQNYLQQVLPAILDGLADENESVRDAALSAGHVFVEHYARTSLPLLLPAIEDGIFNDNWRIRQSSVELLGDLLFKVAGTSGKAILEGGSDDEGSSTEAHGRAIIEVLGRNKRNEVLAAVYMIRSDVSLSVRQAALHVWKTIVANTPKTLKEIMPVLMNTLISSLASSSLERRQVAGRSLGELVRKLGERVLPSIIPILSRGLKDSDAGRRQGVCIGLSEVMASAGKHQLLGFMSELIPTIRVALCDSVPEVRESAGLAFSTLYKSAGLQAIDEIVPTLLHALEDDETSHTALDGLKQILSAFNAHALGALAEVAGPALNFHLGTMLPPLVIAMGDDDKNVQHLAKKAAETVVLVIDEEGISSLMSELLKGVSDNQPLMRRGYAYLIGHFFKNSKLDLVDEAPNMISTLIPLLSDSDQATILVSWEALGSVIGSVPKEVLPSYIKVVRDAVSTARDKERRKRKGGPVLIPGFCLPKALQPLLPIFLQGIISGSAETREQAAQGLGELIDVTGEQTLKQFVVPITGPLIRIIGDRFPWQVKEAILSTLSIIISKGGIALKPFLPQLQTTFIKCLQDNARSVRSSSALALAKLSALSTRIDPLVTDLLSALQASEVGVQGAVLVALKGVIRHAGKSVSNSVKSRACSLVKDFIQLDDEELRSSAAKALGAISKYLEDHEVSDMMETLSSLSSSPNWSARHGSMLTLASMSLNNASMMCLSATFPSVISRLKAALKDDKFPIREAATRALGSLLLHLVQNERSASVASELIQLLSSAMQDESSEVRRRALSCLKGIAKVNPSAVLNNLTILGPPLAESLKDGNTPVRLAAERCALHAFQLAKGSERIHAAQKYITGLEARRLSKLPENSDDSDDSEDEKIGG